MIILKFLEVHVTTRLNTPVQQFLEVSVTATKAFATSAVIFFCIACHITADQFKMIGLQIQETKTVFEETSELLRRFQSRYSSGYFIYKLSTKKMKVSRFVTIYVL